jgi:hypothetical protein
MTKISPQKTPFFAPESLLEQQKWPNLMVGKLHFVRNSSLL